jgi:hypothetical protein
MNEILFFSPTFLAGFVAGATVGAIISALLIVVDVRFEKKQGLARPTTRIIPHSGTDYKEER